MNFVFLIFFSFIWEEIVCCPPCELASNPFPQSAYGFSKGGEGREREREGGDFLPDGEGGGFFCGIGSFLCFFYLPLPPSSGSVACQEWVRDSTTNFHQIDKGFSNLSFIRPKLSSQRNYISFYFFKNVVNYFSLCPAPN